LLNITENKLRDGQQLCKKTKMHSNSNNPDPNGWLSKTKKAKQNDYTFNLATRLPHQMEARGFPRTRLATGLALARERVIQKAHGQQGLSPLSRDRMA